jgi:hypothetical protein
MTVSSVAAAIVGIPTLLVALAHINSLPFSYTIRSWWLLRALVKRAEKLKLEPECMYKYMNKIGNESDYYIHIL